MSDTTYAVSVKGSGIAHTVTGNLADVKRPGDKVTTACCHREVTPRNYFTSVDDYISSYNMNGRACGKGN